MFNNIRACIFDLDGTLVDSMWMWHSIDVEYLRRFGQECPDDLQKIIEGMSFTENAIYFKNRFNLSDSIDKIKSDWEDMSVSKYRDEVTLKPGTEKLLSYLKSAGIKLGIATSNGRKMVDAVLDSQNISDYFSSVVTACEVASGKPSPDIYLKVADNLKIRPENCLVFEDLPAGIIAGKAAGMSVCAIEDEFSKAMKYEKTKLADYFITDYTELVVKGVI